MWNVQSYNGFNLATSSYKAYLSDEDNPNILPTVQVGLLERGEYAPEVTRIERKSDQLVVTVQIKAADWYTAHKNLIGAFPNTTNGTASLILKDPTGALWYVQARPIQALRDTTNHSRSVKIQMLVPDRIWRKSAATVSWVASASPSNQTIANSGNLPTYPVIKIKPTSAKGDGFLYRYWVPIYNPGDQTFTDWALDLTNGGLDTRNWVRDNSISCQLNGAITNSQTSMAIDSPVGGGLPTQGMGWLDDGVHQEQISWTGMTGTPTSGTLTGITRNIGGTSPYAFADNVVIKLSYMKADGADLRYYYDGLETDLWQVRINQATSQLWARASAAPRIELVLKTLISNSGLPAKIEFTNTTANKTAFNKLPSSGTVLLENEAFKYDGKNTTGLYLIPIQRQAYDTAIASHAANITVRFIEHPDSWLYSGNPNLAARINDDTRKPMLDITTSNNNTRVYSEFGTTLGLRAQEWKKSVVATSWPGDGASSIYTGNHQDVNADPFTDAGMRMKALYKNAKWNTENGKIEWFLWDPAGIATVDIDVEKYRVGSSWPATAELQKSKDGATYSKQIGFATPPSASSWTADTPAVQNLGAGFYAIKVRFEGSITGGGGAGGVNPNEADLEVDTCTHTTSAPLVVAINSRYTGSYELNCTIRNNTNGLFFSVHFTMKLNAELTIDCAAKTIIYSVDGQQYRTALFVDDNQLDWMYYSSGNNDISFEESNVSGVQITSDHDEMLVV